MRFMRDGRGMCLALDGRLVREKIAESSHACCLCIDQSSNWGIASISGSWSGR